MKNQNIKAVFVSRACVNGAKHFLAEMEKKAVKIVIMEGSTAQKETWQCAMDKAQIPVFHCVCCDNTKEGLEAAKQVQMRTVAVEHSQLEEIADWFVQKLDDVETDVFLESGRVKQMPVCETALVEEEFVAHDINHMESLFALGNGYMGLRGTYDETDEDIHEVCGMYINGIFATSPYHHYHNCVGFAKQDEYTVNLADWRIINLYIDGEKACFSNQNIKEHRRILDMQNGRVQRNFVFETKTGKHAAVKSIRMVNMDEVHGAQVRYEVTPLDFDGDICLELLTQKNTDTEGKYPCKVVTSGIYDKLYVLEQEVITTKQRTVLALCHEVDAKMYTIEKQEEESLYTLYVQAQGVEGETISVTKYAAIYSSMDETQDRINSAIELACKNAASGFWNLQKKQEEFWNEYWNKADISIKGNPADAQAVRFALFHLRQQLATINACSIGATGLTGPGYSGKVFWDTEMYLMPYYNFTYPDTQKELLMYRYRILDKARERAKEFGLCGAMYSWCSIDGIETSIVFEASTAEYHLNSDIAYAVWRYVDTTQDKEFLYRYGAEIVFETAKFMYRRGCFVDAKGGKFCLNVVCGPDEYACGINNNCYTNLMLQWHLNYALSVAEDMKQNAPQLYKELTQRIDLSKEELLLWKKAADNMYYKYNEELGIHEQDDSYVYNDPVDMSAIPKNCDIRWMYHPLDLWRKQVSKQADVVLINFLRGNLFTQEEKLRNYEYYEPRCNHGSSLSTAIHAIMACELNKPEAYEFFRCSAYMDIGDFKHNTNDGLHVACLGGVWMSVVNGYLGMRHYEDGISFAPQIPEAWEEYQCHIAYRGALMRVTVNHENARFELKEGKELKFSLGGQERTLSESEPIISIIFNEK